MRNLYRIELKKALVSPFFRLSTLAASLIALGSAGVAVYHYYYNMSLIGSFGYEENPWLPVNSLYNLWIAEEAYSVLPYLFYVLLPLFAAFGYAWSYTRERQSGYQRQLLLRVTGRHYVLSKYLAVFLSGALITAIPMLLNLAAVACFVPAVQPDLFYNLQYIHRYSLLFAELFFFAPAVLPWRYAAADRAVRRSVRGVEPDGVLCLAQSDCDGSGTVSGSFGLQLPDLCTDGAARINWRAFALKIPALYHRQSALFLDCRHRSGAAVRHHLYRHLDAREKA